VVAIIVFGPDKLPDYARQAGRMLRTLRQLAESAQQDLRNELGPEFSDLKLTDLDPRAVIRKHILEGLDEDLDAPPRNPMLDQAPTRTLDVLGPGERPPYDAEAT
jgi:sec-independent protein translocase protein TatB